MDISATDLLRVFLVFGLLIGFGFGWNYLTDRLEAENVEGYTWALVVGGVGVTVALAGALIGWLNAGVLLACFVASGSPMILGDVRRHHRKLRHLIDFALGRDHGREQTPTAGEPGATDSR